MRRYAWRGCFCLAAMCLPISAVEGQASGVASIEGRIIDAVSRAPIVGATVSFSRRGSVITTDADGRFKVDVPFGSQSVTVRAEGYESVDGSLDVLRDGAFEVEMTSVAGERGMLTGILGTVRDPGGDGVEGADVRAAGAGESAVTDERGAFRLIPLAPGAQVLELTHLGYESRVDTVEVLAGRVSRVTVVLAVDPLQIDPIQVEVERRAVNLEVVGFYQRELEGIGEFLDRELIEQRSPPEMTDLFERVPGAEVMLDRCNALERYVVLRTGRGGSFLNARGCNPPVCYPRVVLDGQVIHQGGNDPARLDHLIDPEAIEGIEVYPSSSGLPIQYTGIGASCGAILIWTR